MPGEAYNVMGPYLEAIQRVLTQMFAEMTKAIKTLERVPQLLEAQTKTLNSALHDIVKAQAELYIYERMADMQSRKQVAAERKARMARRNSDFERRIQELAKHYDELQVGLDREAQDRIRRLDGHLLEVGKEFEMLRHGKEHAWFWTVDEHQRVDAGEVRHACLESARQKLSAQVHKFLERRREFHDAMAGILIDEPLNAPTPVHVPYWVVDVELPDGQLERRLYGPSRLRSASSQSYVQWQLEELPEMKQVTMRLRGALADVARRSEQQTGQPMPQAHVESQLAAMASKGLIADGVVLSLRRAIVHDLQTRQPHITA